MNGTGSLGNNESGIDLTAEGVTVGGTSAAARNIISGNGQDGIEVRGTTTGSSITGNYIGVGVNGTTAIGNGNHGIDLGSSDLTVGGTASGAGNIVSGNTGSGIAVSQEDVTVQGNYVGTNQSGDDLGNGSDGIQVSNGPVSIGGTDADAGNVIAFNGGHGVVLYDSPSSVQILGNSIHSNDGLGIDLNEDGNVQANDTGDADTGYNGLQNFPVLSEVTLGSTVIDGSLNSIASSTFRLEFFSNSSCDGSGNGEGETYLGTLDVTTDGSGDVTFTATLSTTASVGEWITATATDGSDNTSEFSACVEVTGLNPPTLVAFSGGTATGHAPTLDWSDVSGATSYTLEYADNASFTSSTTVSGLTSSEYTFPTSLADGTYHWRVKASDGSTESDNSSADSFAIIPLFHPGALLVLIAAMAGWLRWRPV